MILRGHEGPVLSAEFDPDGEPRDAARDRTGRSASGAPPEARRSSCSTAMTGPAHTAQFSGDGRRVVSAGDPGTVRVSSCEVCGSIECGPAARTDPRRARAQRERTAAAATGRRVSGGLGTVQPAGSPQQPPYRLLILVVLQTGSTSSTGRWPAPASPRGRSPAADGQRLGLRRNSASSCSSTLFVADRREHRLAVHGCPSSS